MDIAHRKRPVVAVDSILTCSMEHSNKRLMGLDTVLENQLSHWPKCQKLHNYTLFYPNGCKLSLFSLYGQRFPRYRPIFKIAIFGHETCPFAKVPEVAHMHSFYLRGSKLSLFFVQRAAASEKLAHFQNCHIWAWNVAISQSSRSCTYTFFLPQGSKLSLFLLQRRQFPRYGPIFKIAIFGHETWSLVKFPEVAHILDFYPRGSQLSLFSMHGPRLSR